MRMWGAPVTHLCNKHLFGEHVEMHMFVGTIKAGKSIRGYVDNNLITPSLIHKRHEELAEEITKRGFTHKSPLPDYDIPEEFLNHVMDKEKSKNDLFSRCEMCRKRGVVIAERPRVLRTKNNHGLDCQ